MNTVKLACWYFSFVAEVSSKTAVVKAETDLSLACFWVLCSHSEEFLKREFPPNLFTLGKAFKPRQVSPTEKEVRKQIACWKLIQLFFGSKNSLWQDEKQNREQNTGQVRSSHSHVHRSAISGRLTARRDPDVLGSALWSCEAIQPW